MSEAVFILLISISLYRSLLREPVATAVPVPRQHLSETGPGHRL